jgi:hypothetical protein
MLYNVLQEKFSVMVTFLSAMSLPSTLPHGKNILILGPIYNSFVNDMGHYEYCALYWFKVPSSQHNWSVKQGSMQ